MSTDGMKDVEVPEYGTVVVQAGEVHDVFEETPRYMPCWCKSGAHRVLERVQSRRDIQEGRTPHMIGIQRFELTWEVKK